MKSIYTKLVGAIIIVIVVAVVVVSVNKEDQARSVDIITVGVIAPLSGQYGSLGESFKHALDMAVRDEPRIKLIYEDSKFDAKLGLSAFQKLTSVDHIDFLIIEDSPTLNAITPIVAQTKLPTILIFEAKDHVNDTIFQMLPFSYPLFSHLGTLAEKHYKRIVLSYSGANDVLMTNAEYFKKGVASPGTIVGEFKVGDNLDFRTEVTKILALNPDAVTVGFTQDDGIRFITELNRQKGNKKVSVICDANTEFAVQEYIKQLGTKTLEGCLSTNLPDLTSDSFKQAYNEMFHSNPVIGADWGYDSVTIVKSLLDLPKDQWIAKMRATSFDGVSGYVSFDENGTRKATSEDHIFKNGKFVKLEE